MDTIDKAAFVIALILIPVALRAAIKWCRKSQGQRRDWQSLAMIVVGLICMVAVVGRYLVMFILPAHH